MKIILIGTAFPLRGGIAHYIGLLYEYFSTKFNTATVSKVSGSGWKVIKESESIKVITFKRQYPTYFLFPFIRLFPGKHQDEYGALGIQYNSYQWIDSINPFNWIRVGFKVRRMKSDVIVFKFWMPFFAPCYGVIAAIAKWNRKTKVIFIDDNVIPHERRFGDKLITKFAFHFVDGHVVQSHSVQKDLLMWQKNAKWKLLPHPVYEIFGEEISRDDARQQLHSIIHRHSGSSTSFHYSKNEKILLFFGYVREYKGLHTLLDAMPLILAKLKVKLLVVGEFYQNEKEYHDQVQKLKLDASVLFYSQYVPNEQVGMFFSAADVLTLPYNSATQSGIIQIAYNFHRPVIATDVGGLAEVVIHNKTGFIVPPKDPVQLSNAVIKFFEENRFKEFRKNIIEEKKKYSWEYMTEGIVEFCKELGEA